MAKRKVEGSRRRPGAEPEGLTPKQFALLQYIEEFHRRHG